MKPKRRVYNNGKINKMFIEGEQPEGWVLGYTEETLKLKRDKTVQTCLEKYGTESPNQSDIVKVRKVESSLNKYGTEHPMQSSKVKEKTRQTNLERYGVVSTLQSDEVKEKTKQIMLNTYGVEHPSQSEVIKEKTKQTCIEKYGVEYSWQAEEVKEKIKQTNIMLYGVENPSQSSEILEKKKQTWLSIYGVENPSQSENVKEKIKAHNLSHYGVEYTFQSEEVKDKIKQTNLERYGVENAAKSEVIRERIRDGLVNEEVQKRIMNNNLEKYGVPWACMRPEARNYSNNSGPNKKFAELLDKYGIPYEREFHINAYSYDFKIGNILIEIDPYATHNTLWSPFNKEHGISKDYHLNKTLTAEKHGYHCIHVFDWDKYEDIINKFIIDSDFCGNPSEYFEEIQNKEYVFLEDKVSHQGHISEIIKQFINKESPVSIQVYSNKSKFYSGVYKSSGFSFVASSEPKCTWYDTSKNKVVEECSEKAVPIYDCGIYQFIWSKR